MNERDVITRVVREHYPNVQGIYLFGSHGTEDARPDSDVDIALLLPPIEAKQEDCLDFSPCRSALARHLRKDVDLINARQVSTVFQKEIVTNGRLLYCAEHYAVDEFEMLVLSYYQKLNEERKEILDSFNATGRAYVV